MANLQCGAVLISTHMFFLDKPLIIGSMLHVECFFFFFALCSLTLVECWYVLHVVEWGLSIKISHICKMGLTGLHDFYDSWRLCIRRFVVSLVFMKGTICFASFIGTCKWHS